MDRQLNRLRGVARDLGAGRHVVGDDAAGADDGIVADSDACQDDGAAADPDIAPDRDRPPGFEAGAAQGRVARMVGGVDVHAGSDAAIVADHDRGDIKEHAIEIDEHPRAQVDVPAIVAVEGRTHGRALPHARNPLAQQGLPAIGFAQRAVVARQPAGGGVLLGAQVGVAGVIRHASQHFLFFAQFHAALSKWNYCPGWYLRSRLRSMSSL